MKKISIFPVVLAGILFSSSCSKKNGPPPACKIISATNDVGAGSKVGYTLAYDNDGRVSVMSENYGNGTATLVYAYSGNVVLITTTTTVGATFTDSVVLNSDGLPVSSLQRNGADSTLTTYTYSGTEIQKVVVQTNNNTPSIISYTYTNGDMTSSSDGGGGVTNYTYDTSKPSVPGDFFQFTELTEGGVPYIRNTHLATAVGSGNSMTNLSYVFDTKGNITGLTLTNASGADHIDYTYQCN